MSTQSKTNKRVALGLSGGVDSSVAAKLLIDQGYDVTGVYMQCWDAKADGCRAEEDRADAVAVAAKLNIKFQTLDFISAYKERVISYFYREYQLGRTPNPDVMCNKEIKFGLFYEWAIANGFDYVATGHYAQVLKTEDHFELHMGIDPKKDQSYFLYLLDQEKLSHTLFPVGSYRKTDIRKLAESAGLLTANKPDSVGICFIGEVDIKEFLKKQIKMEKGNVLNTKGEVIGTHDGVWFYTIGQRHGYTITKYVGLPTYVVGKRVETNELITGFAKDVLCDQFDCRETHFILPDYSPASFECQIRIRHLGELYDAVAAKIDQDVYSVKVTTPIFGVAPGQSCVFYQGTHCLGGGIIA